MPNALIQTLFSPAFLKSARGLATFLTPDEWDWIPETVVTIAGIVDDIDRLDVAGEDKMNAVKSTVVSAIDDADDVPGWRDLTEGQRDAFIGAIAEIAVFGIRANQVGGLPDEDYQMAFADAIKSIALTTMALLDTAEPKPAQLDTLKVLRTNPSRVATYLKGLPRKRRG